MADYEVGTVTDISFNNIKCESENGVFLSAESKDKIQVQAFQTHTNNVVDIKADTSEYLYREVDGFITKRKK